MNKTRLLESLKQEGLSELVLKGFEAVKREDFFLPELKSHAYNDHAYPIGCGQTISQPYTIAMMLQLLDLKQGHKVLEIGSGCGYVLALLSELVGSKGKVFGVEIVKPLVEKSINNLKSYKDVKVYNRNGALGLQEQAPFDRIIISAACKQVPEKVLSQLKDNGILVAPVGEYDQALTAIQRKRDRFVIKKQIPGFIFVKFVD